jgi:hypothetical protein
VERLRLEVVLDVFDVGREVVEAHTVREASERPTPFAFERRRWSVNQRSGRGGDRQALAVAARSAS